MYSNAFEAAFSEFLDRQEYDKVENCIFSMARAAFAAGWRAAGGPPLQTERLFSVLPGKNKTNTEK